MSNNTPAIKNNYPADPYMLTREQFLVFLGQDQFYKQLLAIYGEKSEYRKEEKAFWSVLAAFEASRQFNPYASCCGSNLCMDTHGDEPGCMRWSYLTTSGTLFECSEPREHETHSVPGYPGTECADELRPGYFRVTIPSDRDQPGRYHHDQLRAGGAYCD